MIEDTKGVIRSRKEKERKYFLRFTLLIAPLVSSNIATALSVLLPCTDFDYPFGIFKHSHCIVSPSIYGF
jgi:hypothetical protein